MPSSAATARILAEAMPYLRAYRGKALVVRFGGRAMADAGLKAAFARDVALLRLVGMKPIVVHGGGWRIDELMLKMGMKPRRHRGRRITDAQTLNLIEMVLDELNQELTGLVNQHGGRAVGLNGQDGRFIHARPLARDAADDEAIDAGFVGDVASVDVELVHLLLSRDFVPVVLPIGVGDDGAAYHVNSDRLAGALARALGAEKLILMTNVAGVPGRSGRLAYILTAREAQALLDEGRVQDDLVPRVTAAVQAVREGVRSVHIIDGGVPSALMLEVLTADGIGTAVRSDAGPHFLEDSRAYLMGPEHRSDAAAAKSLPAAWPKSVASVSRIDAGSPLTCSSGSSVACAPSVEPIGCANERRWNARGPALAHPAVPRSCTRKGPRNVVEQVCITTIELHATC